MELLNHLPRHRAAEPVPDEVTRLTLVGWPAGRSERAAKGFLAGLCLGAPVLVLLVLLDAPWGITFFGALAVPTLWAYARRRLRPRETDELCLVSLTSARTIVMRPGRGREPTVVTHGPEWITWAVVETFASFWIHRAVVPRVRLGGADGEELALELPNVDVDSLRLILEEADLVILPSS